MHRLHLLGRIDLHDPWDGVVRSVLAQPKRLALLAYLCLKARDGVCRRDGLLALFWPELDHEHARKALNKAIYFLRNALGEGVIVARTGDELTIDRGQLWCDAVAFEEAVAKGQHAVASELYRGELLPAFHVADVNEIGEWLESERARLRGLAARSARRLAEEQERLGRLATAVDSAHRAVELSDEDEHAVRHLLELLDRTGDRSGAVRAYESFAHRLASEYDAEPAVETKALIERIRARAAAHDAHTQAPSVVLAPASDGRGTPTASAAPAVPEPPAPAQRNDAERVSGTRTWRIVASTLFAAAIGAVTLTGTRGPAAQLRVLAQTTWSAVAGRERPTELDDRLIVAPPFRVTVSDSSLGVLREGIPDLISAKLTGSIRAVDARAVLKAWRHAGGSTGSDIDRASLIAIGRDLGAGRLLDGSVVEAKPGELTITGTLVDIARPDRAIAVRTQGAAHSVAALVDTLVAKLLVLSYVGPDATTTLAETPFAALEAFLSGQAAFRAGHYLHAATQFRRALDIDSTFALAAVHLGLAAAYSDPALADGAMSIAGAHRDKLSLVERLLLETDQTKPGLDQLRVQEHAVQTAPEVPELWWNLAENLGHWGPAMGIPNAMPRAVAAMERALALDSALEPVRLHLISWYGSLGDTARALRLLAHLNAGEGHYFMVRWYVLRQRADLSAELRTSATHLLMPYDAMPMLLLGYFDELEFAGRYMDSTAITPRDRRYVATFMRWLALNRGQPARARRASGERQELDEHLRDGGSEALSTSAARVLQVILWNADPGDAAPGIAAMHWALAAEPPAVSDEREAWCLELFAAGEYGIAHHELAMTRSAAERLRGVGRAPGADPLNSAARISVLLLDAQLAATTKQSDASRLALAADSALRHFDGESGFVAAAGSLFIARVWEQLGDIPRALAATERVAPTGLWPFYSTFLRERARLATIAGDRQKAITAYAQYVALRAPAEPSQVADLDLAKTELARLIGQRIR
jgi:serine/threonine-protein kinase